jgi:hypothetical protein
MEYSKLELFIDKARYFISVYARLPKVARVVDLEQVDQDVLALVEPTFVLSTGRCGTKWLTEVLRKDPRMRVNHSDYPELLRHSRLAYEGYENNPLLFQEVLRAARDDYLLDAYQRGLSYVETNHRITFFAYAIRQVYPRARFIHLYRHPGDFVRSGLRRHWYSGTYYDVCRPRIQDEAVWNAMTKIERLAWLWNETNQYIDNFLATLDLPGVYLQVKAEEMFSDVEAGLKICELTGAKVNRRVIASMLDRKINQQRTGSMLPYERWSIEEKEQLRRYASLAKCYGYQL